MSYKDEDSLSMTSIRRGGGGRKSAVESISGLDEAFLQVIAQHTAGSPMDEQVKWTNLTRKEIADRLKGEGIEISVTVVDQLQETVSLPQTQSPETIVILKLTNLVIHFFNFIASDPRLIFG